MRGITSLQAVLVFLAALAVVGIAAGPAGAASLTWDADNSTADPQDGSGTWLAPGMWWNGSANTDWNNTTPDDAVIGSGGSGGTIDLTGNPSAGTVLLHNFSGTYKLSNGILDVSGDLALGSNAGFVDFQNTSGLSGTGTITLNGPYPQVKNGQGVLSIRSVSQANLTISGDVTINSGVMLVHVSTPTGNIKLNGGTGATDGAVYESYWGYTLARNLGTAAGEVQVIGGRSGFSGQGTTGQTVRLTDPGIASQTVQWGTTYFNPSELILQSPNANTNGNVNFDTSIDLNGADRTISVNTEHGYHWDTAGNIDNRGRGVLSRPLFNTAGTPAGLIKEGPGRLELNTANTYDGGTTVNEGILHYDRADAMPSTGTTTFNDGTELWVNLKGGDDFTPDASGAGSLGGLLSGTGTGGSTVTYNGNVDLTILAGGQNYLGDIPNLGGAGTTTNVWIWDGSMTLSGTGTYSGTTVIGARGRSAITVTLGSSTALPTGGPVTIDTSGASKLDLNGHNATIGLLKLGSNNGGNQGQVMDSVGGGVLTLTNGILVDGHNDGAGAVYADTVDLNGSTQTFTINNNRTNTTLTVTSVIQSGGLTITGGGSNSVIKFYGSNIYTGDTTVTAGKLLLGTDGTLGTGHLLFLIGAAGSNNRITGAGAVDLAGVFDFDLSGASKALDDSWTIVDTSGGLAATYESTFAVTGFTDAGGNKWTLDTGAATYEFDEATGILKVTSAGQVGDVNGDGFVDAADYILIKQNWGNAAGSSADAAACDLDGSGTVGIGDLDMLAPAINDAAGSGRHTRAGHAGPARLRRPGGDPKEEKVIGPRS